MAEPRVVLVTGARKGIGRFLAEWFAAAGDLVEGCSRMPADWERPGCFHHRADVADEAQVKALMTAIRRRHGRLDVVINNAGVAAMNHALLTPGETVDKIMATNVRGTFLVCRESARLMQPRRFGRIVNLTTVAVPMRLEGEALYAASKSAVETLTRVLAREFAPFGITVNAVGPTPIDTDLIRGVPAEKIQRLIADLAVKRLGRGEDVANVVDFFVRPQSDFVTGQVVYLGGVG